MSHYQISILHADDSQPALIGTTSNDGVGLAPWPLPDQVSPSWWEIVHRITFQLFWGPAQHTSLNRHAASCTTYRFIYDGNFPNISIRPWQRAFHSSDLPLIFGTSHLSNHGPPTDYQKRTAEAMQDAYLIFCEDPEYGLEKIGWKAWDLETGFQMWIGGDDGLPMRAVGKKEIEAYEDTIRTDGRQE
jgi:acetylcholinesterase